MTASQPTTQTSETPLWRDLLAAARYYLGGRRGLLALATVVLVTGLALNWSWLVAIGVAPILVAALPCVAMCALGLCMNKTAGKSCSTETSHDAARQGAEAPPLLEASAHAELSKERETADLLEASPVAANDSAPQALEERRNSNA